VIRLFRWWSWEAGRSSGHVLCGRTRAALSEPVSSIACARPQSFRAMGLHLIVVDDAQKLQSLVR